MNDTRKGPWLSGLVAAATVALVLIATVVAGTWQLVSDAADPSTDISYTP